jgi:hypothetical protein
MSTQPARTTQPTRASHQPAEPRGRSRAEEDPLTSPAYSLRPRGSVDGRGYSSSHRSGDLNREPYAAAGQETQSFGLADAQAAGSGYADDVPSSRPLDRPAHGANGRGRSDGYRSDPPRADPLRPDPRRPGGGYSATAPAAAYPYPQPTYPQPTYSQPTQAMSIPPYGKRNGYESPPDSWPQEPQGPQGVQAGPGGDPRQAAGGWSPGQADGTGDGNWGSRPAYPPVNGYRGAQDTRGYDRRLSTR